MRFRFALLCCFVIAGFVAGAGKLHAQWEEDKAELSTTPQAEEILMGESYAEPNERELAQSFLMLGGMSSKETFVIDAYAKLIYCGLYLQKFKDDFAWQRVRQEIASRIQRKKEYYRVFYEMKAPIYLGRYNFETQDFPLINKSAIVNVGSVYISDANMKDKVFDPITGRKLTQTQRSRELRARNTCGTEDALAYYPRVYRLQLAEPLTFDRIKMSAEDASKVLEKMNDIRNESRNIFARIRFRVTSIDPASIVLRRGQGTINIEEAAFTGNITSVDIFLDAGMTQFIASVPLQQMSKK